MCGTDTLEFSSNTLVIRPLHRILSMHWGREQRNMRFLKFYLIPDLRSITIHLRSVWGIPQLCDRQSHCTWLISLVHAAFSWRDGAKRTTEKDWPSGGSTTTLNSKWLKPWPDALSTKKNTQVAPQLTVTGLDKDINVRLKLWFGIKILTVLIIGI